MVRKKNAGESLFGYKFGMLHPLTGFRSFKHGGIVKRKKKKKITPTLWPGFLFML